MFKRYVCVILLLSMIAPGMVRGQQGDFCDAVTVIMRDAPNKFRNIRGKVQQANSTATLWDCGIRVPGVIKARFVAGMGLFYEGAVLQTTEKEDLREVYDKYKALLTQCLEGYSVSSQDNFYAGLGDYKKLVFMKAVADDAPVDKAPPHVALEATYSKDMGVYTVVIYIFEH